MTKRLAVVSLAVLAVTAQCQAIPVLKTAPPENSTAAFAVQKLEADTRAVEW